MRTRDRFSIAELTQVAANYIGKFYDEKLHVNLGVRLPRFTRDLNQYCYTYNGTSAYCDTINPTLVANALAADTAAHTVTNLNTLLGTSVALNPTTNAPNFRMPFKQTYHFNKALPNVGATYAFDAHNLVYVTYAQGFSAPKTDDLYTSATELVRPETSEQVALGYRYQTGSLMGSASVWDAKWKNHIVQSYDPLDPTLSVDRNVGDVDLYGVDLEGGWKATKHLSFYASAAYTHTEMKQNYVLTTVTGSPDKAAALPVSGKQLVMTPDYTGQLRAEYKTSDWTLGANGHYIGRRYLSDVNDVRLAPYFTLDIDAEYRFKLGAHPAALQLNVSNALNKTYFARANTVSNANQLALANGDTFKANTNYYYYAAPAWGIVTLKVQY
jgi:iron complex outermembrane receptor protein